MRQSSCFSKFSFRNLSESFGCKVFSLSVYSSNLRNFSHHYFLTELSHVLPHTPKSSLKQHALNQRSPARSGIENRCPKGKAKVKGIGESFFRPNCFVHWPNIHLWNRSQFCKLILFIETYCAVIRGMPSSYCQEDATSISLVSSHRSYFFN